jgi:hypothetical protein
MIPDGAVPRACSPAEGGAFPPRAECPFHDLPVVTVGGIAAPANRRRVP